MDKAIEYVLLKVEEAYYEQHPDIRIVRGSCMKDEGLICNCITGIAINYVGYLIFICCNIKDCTIYFEMNSAVGDMKVMYKGRPLISVRLDDLNISQCYLYRKVCAKEEDKQQQTRIAFRRYPSIEELHIQGQQAENIMKEINAEKGIEYCYRLKFWILFLSALRVCSLEESSWALLAMAIFMFPNKTLSYIRETVKVAKSDKHTELKEMARFLNKYSKFLEGLECISVNFSFYEFCIKFKELTTIEIGYFIEEIIYNSKVPGARDTLCEIFSKALSYNLREKKKRGKLSKVIDILNSRGFGDVQCS